MDLRKLTYFVEVIKEQSFSHAAQKLYVTQPMLSKAISQLESEFGAQLIKRNSKSFQITEEGKLVYQKCIKILNDYDELEHILDDSKNLLRGSVSISIPLEVVSLYFIPLFIDIHKKYPEISIDLHEEGSHAVVNALVRDMIDIGVVMLPVPTHDIDVYQIIDDQCALMVSVDHPLASREQVDISELEHESFLLFNRRFVLNDMVRQACYSRQFSPNIMFQSSNTSIVLGMVEKNQGITIMPGPTFPDSNPYLRKIKIKPKIPWKLALIIKKEKYLSPAVLQVVEEILGYFGSNAIDEIKNNL